MAFAGTVKAGRFTLPGCWSAGFVKCDASAGAASIPARFLLSNHFHHHHQRQRPTMSSSPPAIKSSESIAELSKALIKFHRSVPKIPKSCRNPFLKSKYADLSTILDIVQPVLNDCELVIQQHPTSDYGLTTILSHASGEWMSSEYRMMPSESVIEKAKDGVPAVKGITPQSIGSVITYQRRYAIGAILSLNIDDDNDGNEPGLANASSEPQPPKKTAQELMAEAAAKVEAARVGTTATDAKPEVAPTLVDAATIAKIESLCAAIGIDAAGILSICQKRGVHALSQLTQEQAATIITNLAAMAQNAVASGGSSESGVHQASTDGPATDLQVSEIKAALVEWEQSQPGVTADFIARLNGAGFGKIADMNFAQASDLKAAIEAKNISNFFDSMLETASAG